MLPEVQREIVKTINSGEQSQFAWTSQMPSPVSTVVKSQNRAVEMSSSFTPVLQNKSSLHPKNINALTDTGGLIRNSCLEFGRKVPSILQSRAVSQGTSASNTRSTAGGIFPSVGQNGESPFLRGTREINSAKRDSGFKKGIKPDHNPLPMYFNLSSGDTPMKDYQTSLMKTEVSRTTPFQGKESVGRGEFHFGSRAEKPFILSGTSVSQNGISKVTGNGGFQEDHIHKTKVPAMENVFR
jgi:E3 ubiquitin-protein ligase HOS1